ncbi:hypothetical protein A8W25_15490 [Streptomyces sp. ERV7]|uniref:DUF1906 domain-containing protein n=1 Tax=Streptomyces sp. ERV7 TaxID=1322334 RepID=UPI0007F5094E|nr:DUF1906 domain-containing protein [Streptomyces sp. ERV7]OAR23892.1 hypothetical protein A8W25_15490 [Streptomyces sp. ERV7]
MRSLTSIRPWYLGIVTPPLAVATTLAALLTLSPPASAAPAPDVPTVAAAPEAASPSASDADAGAVPDAEAAAAPADAVDSPAVLARAVHFKGAAFDTCQAPPLATMKAWRSSSYRGVGVYFAGRGRGCPNQLHLSRSWLASVDGMGWRVLPIFVGSQSPCVRSEAKRKVRMGSNSATQGRTEGRQAAEAAGRLGIRQGSALYLDMEAYDAGNAGCARTTLAFVRAWNREVRGQGFLPGFYSSAASGVRHMEQARRAGQSDLPSVMWFARWGSGSSLYGEPSLHTDAWRPHRRIHQYAGNVTETHGGRRLVVDRNTVDAPVARFRP